MIQSIVVFFAGVLQIAYFFPRLPESMASHFDGMGQPNIWQSKNEFTLIWFSFWAFLSLMTIFLPRFLKKIPNLLNIPNREYWISSERMTETINRVQNWVVNIITATQLLMMCVFQLVIQANLNGTFLLSSCIWFLIAAYLAYVAYVIYAVICYYRDFRRPSA